MTTCFCSLMPRYFHQLELRHRLAAVSVTVTWRVREGGMPYKLQASTARPAHGWYIN